MRAIGGAPLRRLTVAVALLCGTVLAPVALHPDQARAAAAAPSCSSIWFVTLKSAAPGYGRLDQTGPFVSVGKLSAPSAALAVGAADPGAGYFVGYDSTGSPDGVLRRLDLTTGSASPVSAAAVPMLVTNRLAFAPDGSLWSLSLDGQLWSAPLVAGSLGMPVNHGRVASGVRAGGSGGDIAFDGLGNLWLITNSGGLYGLGAGDLDAPGTAVRRIGDTGVMGASGLAFAVDGTLLATSGGAAGALYRVDPSDARAVRVSAGGPTGAAWVGDLAGCAFGQPRVSATESVTPAGGVLPGGVLTYTIRVADTGTVPSMATLVRAQVPAHTAYIPGSTRLNSLPVPDGSTGFPVAPGLAVNSPGAAAGMVAAGGWATVTFQVRVSTSVPPGLRQLVDQGIVLFAGGPAHGIPTDDPSTSVPGDPTIASLRPGPARLRVVKLADRAVARPGDRVRYTIELTNTGGTAFISADPARLVDDLEPVSADAVYNDDATVSGGRVLTVTGTTLSWAGALDPGQTVRISYSVTVRGDAPDARLVNTVASNSGNCRAVAGSQCTAAVGLTGVPAAPTATTIGSDLAGRAVRGQTVEFWIVVRNTTGGPVQAAVDRDVSCIGRGGVIGQAVPATTNQPGLHGTRLQWTGPLAAGQSVRLGFSVTVLDPAVDQCLRSLPDGGLLAGHLAATGSASAVPGVVLAGALLLVGSATCAAGRRRHG